ncbi:uncharacterized protein [Spinacia oleracea]|uniref:Ubiquitin-like protease family profile domain-containing protein n=1 Tax=Spinacia oleracea TaxID=3562 RepID=A0ABM3RVQ7_SPIOL|nr:uncharacterized protein LOC110793725 [Spinacia oleracea]
MKNSGKTKSFTIPARVFLNDQCVSLDYEDMLDWCFQREIRSSHMLILMMHLSEMVLKDGISGLYRFCDCTYLSPLRRVEKEDDRCDYLYRVFACNDGKNKYQLFFLPYIEDRDWMLVVICPWIALVQWLDPLGAQNEPPEFAQTIINRQSSNLARITEKISQKQRRTLSLSGKKLSALANLQASRKVDIMLVAT